MMEEKYERRPYTTIAIPTAMYNEIKENLPPDYASVTEWIKETLRLRIKEELKKEVASDA